MLIVDGRCLWVGESSRRIELRRLWEDAAILGAVSVPEEVTS